MFKLTATQILKITTPEKLFTQSNLDSELNSLRRQWHPDRNSDSKASAVFAHISHLAKLGKQNIENNRWNGPGSLRYTTSDNKTFNLNYIKINNFELGKLYIGTTKIAYVVEEQYGDLFDNAVQMINFIHFPTAKIKKEFSPLLPKVVRHDKTNIGYIMILEKPRNAVLLQDLLDYIPNNTIPPKHVAWLVGTLLNIGSMLSYNNIAHNAILASTLFIDPKNHSLYLLGGWWYSTESGKKMKALPKEILKIIPKHALDDKISRTKYDVIAIKSIGILALGDKSLVGSKLLGNKDIPKPIVDWLRHQSDNKTHEQYSKWEEAVKESFGKRKFIPFDIDIDKVMES